MSSSEIIGTPGGDILTGSDGADVIIAKGGNDSVNGAAGDDVIRGGPGNDDLIDGPGNDQLFGGPGNDALGARATQGQGGADLFFGGPGSDALVGGFRSGAAPTLFGGAGDDQITVGVPGGFRVANGGTAYGGSGNDTINGEESADRLFGGDGNDTIRGFDGPDVIFGGRGDDTLSALTADTAVADAALYGGEGNDRLNGNFTTPTMYGGVGDDTLALGHFGPGSESHFALDGGPGFDTLDFFAADSLTLSAGDPVSGIERITLAGSGDTLTLDVAGVLGASDETDSLIVAKSRDFDGGTIIAQGGWELTGTRDVDGVTFNEWQAGGATLLVDPTIAFDPHDVDQPAASQAAADPPSPTDPVIFGTAGDDALTGTGGADVIFAKAGDDTVQADEGNDIVFGGAGNDTLSGGNGDDQLFGGPGNDTISDDGQVGNDLIAGGLGDDVLIGGLRPGVGALTFFGGGGNDQIFIGIPELRNVGGSPATAYGGPGNDTILGENGSERFFGGDGNDRIDGFEGNDVIFGGRGDDTLSAGTADTALGQSTLYGDAGDDHLSGGFTTPAMFGGAGNDVLSLGHFDSVPLPGDGVPDFELVFDGGPGFDTLDTGRANGVALSADDNIAGIERIELAGPGSFVSLDPDGVLGASDETDTLVVDIANSFTGGRVIAQANWQLVGTQDIDGVAFNEWHADGAILLVNPTIDFDPL